MNRGASKGGGPKAFRALGVEKYRWYWFSGLGMSAAQGIQQLAVAWLVLDLTGSVGQLGLVIFMQGVPMALASFYGGVLADRYDRRAVLVCAQTVTMLNLLTLAVLTMTGAVEVWHVYLSSIGLGLMQSTTMPARQALINSLVGRDDMLNAVALNAVQMHSSRIIWPSLAGAMIEIVGIGSTLAMSAACSLAGIVCLFLIRGLVQEARPARTESHFREATAGMRYSYTAPAISTVMILSLCCGLFGLAYMNLAPGFAREELGLSASGAGFFMMAMGIGAIIGSGLLLVFPVKDGQRVFTVLTGVFGLLIVAIAVNPTVAGAFALMAVFGLSNSALVVAGQTVLQVSVPPHMLGRVVGQWSLAGGLGFVTALPIGFLGDEVGLRWSLAGAGLLLALSAVWFGGLSPEMRRQRRSLQQVASGAEGAPAVTS